MERDTELLFEISSIRHIKRMWHRFLGTEFSELADHHFTVAWIALIIAAREGKGDIGTILKMALVHDIAESRTGDVDYISRQYVKKDEALAMEDILEQTSVKDEMLKTWHEYEKRESIEAKIVKDADNLHIDIELREQWAKGNKLSENFQPIRDHVASNHLYTQTAKDMHREIIAANPHDWHTNAKRNRMNSGDWSKIAKGKQQ